MHLIDKISEYFNKKQEDYIPIKSILPGWSSCFEFEKSYRFITADTVGRLCRELIDSNRNEDRVYKIGMKIPSGMHTFKYIFDEEFMLEKILEKGNKKILNEFKHFYTKIPELCALHTSVIIKHPRLAEGA